MIRDTRFRRRPIVTTPKEEKQGTFRIEACVVRSMDETSDHIASSENLKPFIIGRRSGTDYFGPASINTACPRRHAPLQWR